jgi:hypothetical protein
VFVLISLALGLYGLNLALALVLRCNILGLSPVADLYSMAVALLYKDCGMLNSMVGFSLVGSLWYGWLY